MAVDPLTKIAYKTLQQGKSIAGLAHKEISSRLMNLISVSYTHLRAHETS